MSPRKRTLDEEADELLAQYAKQQGCSPRKLGVLDRRRRRTVGRREVPFTALGPHRVDSVWDMLRELPDAERRKVDERRGR